CHIITYARIIGYHAVAIDYPMKTCPLCGDRIYAEGEGILCYRCKDTGGQVRLEIYDRPDAPVEPVEGFSDAYLGKLNYKSMRKRNLHRGGFC
ncbi:MAG: hypothetical protein MN733_20160, partial [Nitrososphaera sp.]|nr:hypothetical protein [Nitrososphaera sp.]